MTTHAEDAVTFTADECAPRHISIRVAHSFTAEDFDRLARAASATAGFIRAHGPTYGDWMTTWPTGEFPHANL